MTRKQCDILARKIESGFTRAEFAILAQRVARRALVANG